MQSELFAQLSLAEDPNPLSNGKTKWLIHFERNLALLRQDILAGMYEIRPGE
jgi:hypothetical protein